MKAEDLKTKTTDELGKVMLDLKKEQFNLRFQLSQGQLAKTARVRGVRRDIARVQTFLNAKSETVKAGSKPKAEKKAAAPKAKKAAKKTDAA